MPAQIISTKSAEHYKWGADCDGWHLVKTADLSVSEERMPAGTSETRADFRQRFSWIAGLRKPIIGAINGACVGMGFTTALYHDIRIASTRARMGSRSPGPTSTRACSRWRS